MTRLAGRCHCGVALELAERDPIDHRLCAQGEAPPDPFCPGEGCGTRLTAVAGNPEAHMRCHGLRWCGVCGDAARYGGDCPTCRKRRVNAYRERHTPTDAQREKARQYAKRWAAAQRRKGTEYYARDKARKRARYLADPEFAEAKKAAFRSWWASEQKGSGAEVAA